MAKIALRGLKGRLVKNSTDAFVLALENVNRLSGGYRVESFAFLIVNAWELLLKARLLHLPEKGSIFYIEKSSTTRKTIKKSVSIGRCINLLFSDQKDPVRCNLEAVIEERDKATHLVIPRITNEQLAVFQSCVVNYHRLLGEWFGISLADRLSIGMMTIVFENDAHNFDITNKSLKSAIGKEGVLYLADRQRRIRELQLETNYSIEFASQIEHKIAIVRSANSADITLNGGPDGQHVRIIEKPRDPGITHPHRRKHVVQRVKEAIPSTVTFNEYDFDSIRSKFDISSNNNEFHFCSETYGAYSQYSQEMVDWIVEKIGQDPGFLSHCRAHFKEAKQEKKQSSSGPSFLPA